MEQLLTKIFKEEFPETLFLYKSEGFSLNEAMSPSGLLPAFVEQALSMASVLGPSVFRMSPLYRTETVFSASGPYSVPGLCPS